MTDTVLIVARAIHFIAVLQLAGLLGFTVLVADPPALRETFRRIATVSWALALLSGAAWFYAETSVMAGVEFGLAWPLLDDVLEKTGFGWVFAVRLAFLLIMLPGLRLNTRWARRITARLALLPLVALAWTGHANGENGFDHILHLAADAGHLLAAAAWLGGLVPLALTFAQGLAEDGYDTGLKDSAKAARRFSRMGILAVAILFASGIVNTWYLAGSIPELIGTFYGRLLLIKIALFVVMLGIAAFNRRRLTPQLSSSRAPARAAMIALRRNSLIETALGLAVVLIVAWLGTLEPAAHDNPVWPLPFRFDATALYAPEFRGQVMLALACVALGLLLIAASFKFRRLWGVVVVVWIVVIAFFLPSVALLGSPAYPTTYLSSPTGYTAASVAAGKQTFAANCVSCHGPEGRGDGPQAKTMTDDPPADLTAEHIFMHTDGDIYWWLIHGIENTAMPGFGDTLDDKMRWNLVDFVHANADGLRAAEGTPATMPDFSIECPGGAATSLRGSRGRIIHLVFAPEPSRLTALAAFDPGADVLTVIAPVNESPQPDFCTATDPDLAAAYALYLVDRSKPIAGTELLIDANGWLRALWQPSLNETVAHAGWSGNDALRQDIIAIRAEPITASARPMGHVH